MPKFVILPGNDDSNFEVDYGNGIADADFSFHTKKGPKIDLMDSLALPSDPKPTKRKKKVKPAEEPPAKTTAKPPAKKPVAQQPEVELQPVQKKKRVKKVVKKQEPAPKPVEEPAPQPAPQKKRKIKRRQPVEQFEENFDPEPAVPVKQSTPQMAKQPLPSEPQMELSMIAEPKKKKIKKIKQHTIPVQPIPIGTSPSIFSEQRNAQEELLKLQAQQSNQLFQQAQLQITQMTAMQQAQQAQHEEKMRQMEAQIKALQTQVEVAKHKTQLAERQNSNLSTLERSLTKLPEAVDSQFKMDQLVKTIGDSIETKKAFKQSFSGQPKGAPSDSPIRRSDSLTSTVQITNVNQLVKEKVARNPKERQALMQQSMARAQKEHEEADKKTEELILSAQRQNSKKDALITQLHELLCEANHDLDKSSLLDLEVLPEEQLQAFIVHARELKGLKQAAQEQLQLKQSVEDLKHVILEMQHQRQEEARQQVDLVQKMLQANQETIQAEVRQMIRSHTDSMTNSQVQAMQQQQQQQQQVPLLYAGQGAAYALGLLTSFGRPAQRPPLTTQLRFLFADMGIKK